MSEGPGQEGNLFLLDVRDSSAITSLVEAQAGVNGKLQLVGYIVARMTSKNGLGVGQLRLSRHMQDRAEAVRLTTATALPSSLHIKQGQWWPPESEAPLLAVSSEAQHDYQVKLGDRMRFQVAGRFVEAPVVAIFDREARAPVRYDLVFPRAALAGLPVVYYGAVHADPQRIPDIEAAIFDRYPSVTVMNLADILKRVQDAVDQIALVIRFLASFAVAAGLIILAATVVGTRYRRVREIAILKSLGGTRQHIRAAFLLEFSVLGVVAGAIGGVLANLFMKVLSERLIEVNFDVDYASIALAIIATALVTNIAGWLASSRMLGQTPLQVLRGE
jgi:putative ABC transport system permease protein